MKRYLLILVAGLLLSGPSLVQAKEKNTKKERVVSKSTAISAAKKKVKGKVLSANLVKKRNSSQYKVKMLVKDKRVKTVVVDGKSGKVIKKK